MKFLEDDRSLKICFVNPVFTKAILIMLWQKHLFIFFAFFITLSKS